jgi:hypothetical protein
MKAREYGPVVTLEAGEALTANRFVDFAGKHTVDKRAIGVCLFATDSGDQASIQCTGIAVVEAGGSITAGNLVSSDADGKAVALTISAVADVPKQCGVALDDASSGEFLRVKLG